MAASSSQAVPSLLEICCRSVAAQLQRLPCSLQMFPPRTRAAILRHALLSDRLDDFLHLFALSSISLCGSRVTDKGLRVTARVCGSQLLALDVSRCVRLHDAGVCHLLERCSNLRELNLSNCRFSDVSIECAARCCPELREIDFSWNGSGVGDRAVRALASHGRRLVGVALSGCRACDSAILSLACSHPELRRLEVRGCHLLTEGGIVAALSKLPLQTTLPLCQFSRICEVRGLRLPIGSPARLCVSQCNPIPLVDPVGGSRGWISWVDRAHSAVGPPSSRAYQASVDLLISHLPRIEILDLSMCDRITDNAIASAVARLASLSRLECYGMPRLHAPHIASQSLQHVVLSGCRTLTAPTISCPLLDRIEVSRDRNTRDAKHAGLETVGCEHTAADASHPLQMLPTHHRCKTAVRFRQPR